MFLSPNPFGSSLKTRTRSSLSLLSPSPSPSPSPSSHQNLNPKHKDHLFNFHESPLDQIFLQSRRLLSADPDNPGKSKSDHDQIPSAAPLRRRRAGKKDRHSKIRTAQGIRDRRMRLSLQVARKFFDLQDMLGYDKASKTIEWLFTQSNKAIEELAHDLHLPPNNSESEGEHLSGIEEIVIPATANPAETAKASRDKARARARCRTREKMLAKRLRFSENPNNSIGGDEGPNPYAEEIRVSQQLSDMGMIEKFMGNSSCCLTSDYHCTLSDPGSLGNWDALSNERSNCFHYSVVNQVSFQGSLNSVLYSATPEFP